MSRQFPAAELDVAGEDSGNWKLKDTEQGRKERLNEDLNGGRTVLTPLFIIHTSSLFLSLLLLHRHCNQNLCISLHPHCISLHFTRHQDTYPWPVTPDALRLRLWILSRYIDFDPRPPGLRSKYLCGVEIIYWFCLFVCLNLNPYQIESVRNRPRVGVTVRLTGSYTPLCS